MMDYKGYKAQIDFDSEDGRFYGEVINVSERICFAGQSVTELKRAFEESVDDFLDCCASSGSEGPRPYTGRLAIHVNPAIHETIATAARREGKPLHTWIAERLTEAARS